MLAVMMQEIRIILITAIEYSAGVQCMNIASV